MKNDRVDARMAELLEGARREMSEGWEGRACGAIGEVKPARRWSARRMAVIALATVLLSTAGVALSARLGFLWFGPVEGTLHVRSSEAFTPVQLRTGHSLFSSFFRGELEMDVLPEPGDAYADHMDLSPVADEIVFHVSDGWPPTETRIYTENLDGSGRVDLSEAAGLDGINCAPRWSRDGSMIGFQHCDPSPEVLPCDAGFRVWAMSADGSDARPVSPDSLGSTWMEDWAPDGAHLLVTDSTVGTVLVLSLDGAECVRLPNVGPDARWSPDGSQIVSSGWRPDVVAGVRGVWRQLLLTDGHGENPEVLVQQFIADSDVEALFPDNAHRQHDCRHWAGPVGAVWSPGGDKIAFVAALPFDPGGSYYRSQVDVWLYDLKTDEVTRLTDDEVAQYSLSWKP